jgi:hypothetical protein
VLTTPSSKIRKKTPAALQTWPVLWADGDQAELKPEWIMQETHLPGCVVEIDGETRVGQTSISSEIVLVIMVNILVEGLTVSPSMGSFLNPKTP